MEELNTKLLRTLDDISASNMVISHRMKKWLNKNTYVSEIPVDFWCHGNHWFNFKYNQGKFNWTSDETERHSEYVSNVDCTEEFLTSDEKHKFLLFTYRQLCESVGDQIDFIDSPEELLNYADSKLQSILLDEE